MSEARFFVSPDGDDAAPGTRERPFATIAAAQAAARCCGGPAVVEVLAGTYRESLMFDAADSGDVYFTRERACITGGISVPYAATRPVAGPAATRFPPQAVPRIRGIDFAALGVLREEYETLYPIGRYSTGEKYGMPSGWNIEVFEDGRRMLPARWPNEKFAQLAGVADQGQPAEFPPQCYHEGWDELQHPRPGAYLAGEEARRRAARWHRPDDVWLYGYFYWDWADSSTPASIDPETGVLTPRFVSRFGARAGAAYYFYDIPEELDVPGEYWIDRGTGTLYLYPHRKDGTFSISVARAPLVCLRGACGMTFEGFTLTDVRASAMDAQGDGNVFRRLTICNAAEHGAVIRGFRNVMEDCEISHTGCGGVRLEGGDRATLTPGENVARDNRIHDFAQTYRTYQAGVALSGVGNRCAHNEISSAPHVAVWYEGNEHVIEYNHIHDVVLSSGDAGAVYSGFDWAAHGTVIRYNFIERVGSEAFAANGIYWDDGLSGQTAYGNVLSDVHGCAFLVGGGRDNVIRSNCILGACASPVWYDARNRDGLLNGGWAGASCSTPDAPHWKKLRAVPRESAVWHQKYPTLARLTCDFSDPDDPDFPLNPAGSAVEGNVIIHPEKKLGNIDKAVRRYSRIEANEVYSSAHEAGFDEAALGFLSPRESFDNDLKNHAGPECGPGQPEE